jgi:DNA-binding NarL/FixJ family response regulator
MANEACAGPLIAIADDHPLMRGALLAALRDVEPGARFVDVASHAALLALLRAPPTPDLLLLDLHMPDGDGIAGVRGVREQAPDVPVAVISADEDRNVVRALLALGVAGFIPKTDPPAVVKGAVRLILAGGTYVPPRLIGGDGDAPATAPAAGTPLTERQMDVVRLLARGLSNKAIARELGVTEGTVKVHLLAVFRVLDVRNRTAAVLEAQRFLR